MQEAMQRRKVYIRVSGPCVWDVLSNKEREIELKGKRAMQAYVSVILITII